jgi:hypothetical protein
MAGSTGRRYALPSLSCVPGVEIACGLIVVSSCVRLTEQAAYQQRPGPRRTQAYAYQPKGHLTN